MDPFKGKIEEGNLYRAAAVRRDGSTPGMVYGLSFAKELGLLDDTTAGSSATWWNGATASRPTPCRSVPAPGQICRDRRTDEMPSIADTRGASN